MRTLAWNDDVIQSCGWQLWYENEYVDTSQPIKLFHELAQHVRENMLKEGCEVLWWEDSLDGCCGVQVWYEGEKEEEKAVKAINTLYETTNKIIASITLPPNPHLAKDDALGERLGLISPYHAKDGAH